VPNPEAVALRELADRLRSARARAELTQEVLAARADIDYRRYQRLEQGRVNATFGTLVRIATALHVTVWDLLAATTARRGPSQRMPARTGKVARRARGSTA
jgi:transcriptional regulator with XRE-family HTH domain